MPSAFRETTVRGSLDFPYRIYTSIIPDFMSSFPMHWHDDFELIWIKNGHVWINLQSQIYLCNPDDILIVPPKYIHSMKQYKNERVHYYNVVFKFDLLEQDEESVISKKYFEQLKNAPHLKQVYLPAGSETNLKFKPLIDVLYETRHQQETSEMRIKAMLYLMMDEVNKLIIPETETFRSTKKTILRLKPVFSKIEENFSEDFNVDEMSALACLSRSRFMTVFKKVTGQTFVNYVNMIRLEKAKKLILETESSILDVSEMCGFHNFSYFIRAFKKQYGKTPLSIRKKP